MNKTTPSPCGASAKIEESNLKHKSKVGIHESLALRQAHLVKSTDPVKRGGTGKQSLKTLHGRRSPLFGFEHWASSGELAEISFERQSPVALSSDEDFVQSDDSDSDSCADEQTEEEEGEDFSESESESESLEEGEDSSDESDSESESFDESLYSNNSKEDFTLMSVPSSTGTFDDFETIAGSQNNHRQFASTDLPTPPSHDHGPSRPPSPFHHNHCVPDPTAYPLSTVFDGKDFFKRDFRVPAFNLPPKSSNVGDDATSQSLQLWNNTASLAQALASGETAPSSQPNATSHNGGDFVMPFPPIPAFGHPPNNSNTMTAMQSLLTNWNVQSSASGETAPSAQPNAISYNAEDFKPFLPLSAFDHPPNRSNTMTAMQSLLTNWNVQSSASGETAPSSQPDVVNSHARTPLVPPGVVSTKAQSDKSVGDDDHHTVVGVATPVPLVEDDSAPKENPGEVSKSQCGTSQQGEDLSPQQPGRVETETQTEDCVKATGYSISRVRITAVDSETQTTLETHESHVSGTVDEKNDTADGKTEIEAMVTKHRQEAALAASAIGRLETSVSQLTLKVKDTEEELEKEKERSVSEMTIWRQRCEHFEARVKSLEDQNRGMAVLQDGRDALKVQLASSFLQAEGQIKELEAGNALLSYRAQHLEHKLACQELELPNLVAAWYARCGEFQAEADRAWKKQSEAEQALAEREEKVKELKQQLTRQHDEATAVIARWQASYAELELQTKVAPIGHEPPYKPEFSYGVESAHDEGPMLVHCDSWLETDSFLPKSDLSEGLTHQLTCTVKWTEGGSEHPRIVGIVTLKSCYATFADVRVAIQNNVVIPGGSDGWKFLLVGSSKTALQATQEPKLQIRWFFPRDRVLKDGWNSVLSIVLCPERNSCASL